MNVANRLKILREAKNISVNKLANLAGLSQTFVREIELGNKQPTIESLELLCEALGVSLKDFFDDELIDSFRDDKLFQRLYNMSKEQRDLFIAFLDMIKTI